MQNQKTIPDLSKFDLKRKESITLRDLIKRTYDTAVRRGLYDAKPDPTVLMMHIVKEATEASDAQLLNNLSNDRIMGWLQEQFDANIFEKTVKNTLGDELADVILMAISASQYLGVDIEKHIELKMQYNETRSKFSPQSLSYRVSETQHNISEITENTKI